MWFYVEFTDTQYVIQYVLSPYYKPGTEMNSLCLWEAAILVEKKGTQIPSIHLF